MKIVIAGAGEVGSHLAKMLSNQNHDLTVIDESEERLERIAEFLDILTLQGSPSSIEVLNRAAIEKAHLFIAVSPSEQQEINLISALLAKKMGAKRVTARVDNEEYLESDNRSFFNELGIDLLFYPEKIAAEQIVDLIEQGESSEYMSFSSGKIHLTAIKLEEESPLIESTLEESLEGSSTLLKSVAVVRNNKTFIPKSDTRYQKGDLLFILSKREGDTKIAYLLGREKRKVRKLMIVGGTPIGKMVAERMEKMVDRVVLVEEDRERCDYLNEKLNNSLVINGSAQEEDLLIGERLAESDLFIAVTQSSEKNILSSIMAKKLGVKRAIAEVEHLDYITLATNMGVDAVINKKLITASQIYRFTLLHTTQTVKCLNGSDANLLEYIAAPNTLVTKKKIGELNLPPEVIIGGIIRGSNAVIATAETQINPYDRVLLVALSSSLRVINRFFM